MNFFVLSCFTTAILTGIICAIIFFNDYKSKVNRAWLWTSISIIIWTVGLGGTAIASNETDALFWQRVLYVGTILIPIFFYNFCLNFLGRKKRNVIFFSGLFLAVLFIFLSFSRLFIIGVGDRVNFGYWPVKTGYLYLFFLAYFIFYAVYSIIILKVDYKKYTGIYQKQIQYVYYAALIGFIGGSTNFLLDFNLGIHPFGNYFVILYVAFIAYAILKHHLFDVKVITTEMLTLAILIILFVKVLLSNSFQDLTLNIIIFGAVLVFGVLLIQSALKEVKDREKIKRAYEIEKKAKEDLQKLDDLKTEFMLITQHHLRTPLTVMQGYADLIENGSLGKAPKKIKDVVHRFRDSTVGLIKIVNEFLDISQFQLGKEVIMPQPNVDMEKMAENMVSQMKPEADKKGIFLETEKDKKKIPLIAVDQNKLEVVLFNVIDNAIKYTEKGGIIIKLKTESGKIKITVQDTGIGIDKKDLEIIFTRVFTRNAQAKKANVVGKGIGLYLSAKIIEAHNGRIWAESEGKDKGSIFYIELPVE